MEGISDIKIIGVDAKRPPVIRKEPYINIYFKLSHKVPPDWSQDFNALLSKHPYPAKISAPDGLYIETWVRKAKEIPEHLALLKIKVGECNDQYMARILRSKNTLADQHALLGQESGEQGELNRIIAGLDFEEQT